LTLQDVLHLGPFNLPVRYVVFVLSIAVGYGVMSAVLLRRPELRRRTGNRLITALLLFILVWKLEPLAASLLVGIFGGRLDWSSIFLQIFVPGGNLAAFLGGIAATAYLGAGLFVSKIENRPDAPLGPEGADQSGGPPAARLPLAQSSLALAAAIAPALLVYIAASLLLTPHITVGGGSPPTGVRPVIGTSVGDLAPGFDADALSSGRLSLTGKPGKVIVLNFWATWCPPCRAELPDLVRFSETQQTSRIEVWAVDMTSSESSVGAVEKFARANHLRFPVLLDRTGTVAAAYKVTAVPTTYVISSDGMITAKQVGAMSPSWLRSRVTATLR